MREDKRLPNKNQLLGFCSLVETRRDTDVGASRQSAFTCRAARSCFQHDCQMSHAICKRDFEDVLETAVRSTAREHIVEGHWRF